ncbi:hypothetical protein ABW19_dt0206770 [Dactylella cylindrospora]|nr:hypothetical protein ABW19_dt0206770 [Dactylella cylindrospora]
MKPYSEPKYSPHKMHRPLKNTITCNGGESRVHPNGMRPFTVRELASFQTFPHDYKFGQSSDTDIIKQIGNTWPPNFAKSIFQAIIRHLEDLDNQEEGGGIL